MFDRLQIKIKYLNNSRLNIPLEIDVEIIPLTMINIKKRIIFHMGHKIKAIMLWTVCNISHNLVFQLVHIPLYVIRPHVNDFKVFSAIYEHDLFEIN